MKSVSCEFSDIGLPSSFRCWRFVVIDVLTCVLEQVWIHGIGSDQGDDFTYLWYDENNDPIPGDNSFILAVSDPGFYTFEVLDGSNGCASSALVEVIQNIESPDFSLSVPTELTCCET